jgi:hypothetical protein
MTFNFSSSDLSIWLAGISLTLIVASELLAPFFGTRNVVLEVKKIRIIAIVFCIGFMFTVGIKLLTLTSAIR